MGIVLGMANNALTPGEVGSISYTAKASDGSVIGDGDSRKVAKYTASAYYGDAQGKRKRARASGTTRRKAEQALKAHVSRKVEDQREQDRAKRRGVKVSGVWEEFAQAHLEWIESDDSDYSDATVRTYSDALENHVLTEGHTFAGRKLSDIAHLELREWLQTVANAHGNGAAHTVKSLVGGMYKRAVGYGLVEAPGPMAGMGKVSRSRKTEVKAKADAVRKAEQGGKAVAERDHERALTAEDQVRLLAFIAEDKRANDSDIADLIRFMLGTGVRIGEALALRWEDVKVGGKAPHVSINGTLSRVVGQGIVRQGWTKTEKGDRKVYVGGEVADMLRERHARMTKVGHDKPLPMSPEGAVFPSISGTWRDQSNVNATLRYVFDHEEVGLSWATSHVFRKTVVTDLLSAGMAPNAVAAHVGHSDASFTLRVYADSKTAPTDAGNLLELARSGVKVDTKVDTSPSERHLRVV